MGDKAQVIIENKALLGWVVILISSQMNLRWILPNPIA